MKTTRWLGLTGLLLMGMGSAPLHADEAGLKDACSADVQKYCSSVQPGGGRIAACLGDNQSSLTSGCQSAIQDVKQKVQTGVKNFKTACGADMEKFCADVRPGQGRRIVCLNRHKTDLSSTCQQQLASMHGPRQGKRGDGSPNTEKPAPESDDGN